MPKTKYCPQCGNELIDKQFEDRVRKTCSNEGNCDYVYWNNPVPVVGAIVEHEGDIILARNVAWPAEWYAIITGFLEKGESAEQGILRELKEELNLDGEIVEFVGVFDFFQMNQLILVYHVKAYGEIKLSEELVDYRRYKDHEIKPWPMGTGQAVKKWQNSRGIFNETIELPRAKRD
jgi:NAD+ diphosphatase